MDGVVADWLTPTLELVGLEASTKFKSAVVKDYDALSTFISDRLLYARIHGEGPKFWLQLQVFPWANAIFNLARKYAFEPNIAFLSKTGKHDYAPTGKRWWRDKYYPDTELVLAKRKSLLACHKSFLIDDCPQQIDSFAAEGGHVFKWPCQYTLTYKKQVAATLRKLDTALKKASIDCALDCLDFKD